MKGLSIKKVAAVAAGAVLVGTAFAPIVSAQFDGLQKSDIFNDNGTPNVKIVVGSDSAPSDGVWAGNIAAAIAEQARAYKSVSVSGTSGSADNASVTDLSAKLVIGGTQTFDNAKTYKTGETSNTSDLNFTEDNKEIQGLTISNSSLKNLVNESRTIKWNGANYTRTMKEEIGLTVDVEFDADAGGGVADLEAYIKTDDINYMLNLGTGIPVYEGTASTTKFTDGTNDNVKIPFFGTDYLVREVDKSNNFIRLIQEQGKLTFVEGDVITGLKGKNSLAGQDVSIKVDSVTAAGPAAGTYSAKFVLVDADGTEVDVYTAATGESLNEQFVGSDGDEALETLVYVDTISVGASSGVGEIGVTIGTTLVDLYSGKGYPYDASQTNAQYDYKVNFTYSSDGNYVTNIAIYNDQQDWRNSGSNDPLYPSSPGQALTSAGQSGSSEAFFLGNQEDGVLGKNFFSVQFLGFETDEPTTQIKLTSNSSGVPILNYTDSADRAHTIPFMITLSKSKSSDSFSFDGQTIYYASQYSANGKHIDVNMMASGNNDTMVNGTQMFLGIDTNGLLFTGSGKVFDVRKNSDVNAVDINGFYALATFPFNGGSDTNSARLTFDGNITFAESSVTTTSGASSTSDYLETWTSQDGNTNYSLYYSDANTSDLRAYRGNTVSLKGEDDVLFEYAMFADASSDGELYLLLDTTTDFQGRYDSDMNFWGTDLTEKSRVDVPADFGVGSGTGRNSLQYYWPDKSSDFGGGVSEAYYIAIFGVETGGDTSNAGQAAGNQDTNIYINTATGKPPIGTSSKTNLSSYAVDVNVNANWAAAPKIDETMLSFALDERADTTDIPSAGYTEQGTKYELSGGEVTITVPDSVRKGVVVVKTEGTTTVSTGGEELVIAEGESGTTSGGTEITVSEITYSASCTVGDSGEESTCAATPENYFEPAAVPEQMVFLDSEAPSGGLVLIGGHFVNRMSAQVSNIKDVLTASGDGRTPWQDADTGNWIVAGYTADDTVASARAFIAAVEAIDMMG